MPVNIKGGDAERQIALAAQNLAQGISQQPPHLRFPGQLEDAVNAVFDFTYGAGKRPGTRFSRSIPAPTLAKHGNYRTHPIKRDAGERYIVVYGEGILRVFDIVNGTEATVSVTTNAQKYLDLNDPTADDLMFATGADTTFIINKLVPVSTKRSADYTVTASWYDYDRMVSHTPAEDTYHQTQNDGGGELSGYYFYEVSGVTFAKAQFAAVSGSVANPGGFWDDAGGDKTFRIHFQKFAPPAPVTGNYTETAGPTYTLTEVGAFAGYTFVPGDMVKITAGTGVTAGWYSVASKVSDDAITITADINGGGGNIADNSVVWTSIATRCDVAYTQDSPAKADMYEVAAKVQLAIRTAGATDALCEWTSTGYEAGYFTITSPYRGSNATILDVGPTGTGFDMSGTVGIYTYPFNPTGWTVTAGTGSGSLTLDPDSRWTRQSAPNQEDAAIDEATMPVKMIRTAIGPAVFGVDVIDWNQRLDGDADSNPSPSLWQHATTGPITLIDNLNPGRITSVGHGLSTGDVVTIVASNSSTSVDGTWTITKISDDIFSIPIDLSGMGADGTSGRWSSGGVSLADMALLRGRLCLMGAENLVLSQAGDLYNFYLTDADNIVDSDPIDLPIGSDEIAEIDFGVPTRQTLVLFTKAGRQFEMNSPDTLSPSSAQINPTTSFLSMPANAGTKPKALDGRLYFPGPNNRSGALYEYIFDDIQQTAGAVAVSAHVPNLMAKTIRTMTTAQNRGSVYILEEDAAEILCYKTFWSGSRKDQSAWSRFVFDSTYRISDICGVDDDIWMLVEQTSLFTNSAASPTVVTSTAHGYSNGDLVTLIESTSKPSVDGTFYVRQRTADTFQIDTDAAGAVGDVNCTVAGTGRICRANYFLERFSATRDSVYPAEPGLDAWEFDIHLDRQIQSTGVYDAFNNRTVWTMPTGLPGIGSTLNRAVLGPAFGASEGTELVLTYYTATEVGITGDYSAGKVCLGRFYDFTLQLSRPYVTDQNNQADTRLNLVGKWLVVTGTETGAFRVRLDYPAPGPTDVTTTASLTSNVEDIVEIRAMAKGRVSGFNAYIDSTSAKPVFISGVEWVADVAYGPKWRSV